MTARIALHLETWDDTPARDVILAAARACGPWINPEATVADAGQDMGATGTQWGELDIWFTVQASADAVLESDETVFRAVVGAIRASGRRVKTAGVMPVGFEGNAAAWLYGE